MLHTLHTLPVVLISPVKGYIKRLARLQANEPYRKEILENSLTSLGGEVHFPRQWYGIPVAIVNEYIWQCFCILLQFVPCQRARSSSPSRPLFSCAYSLKLKFCLGFMCRPFVLWALAAITAERCTRCVLICAWTFLTNRKPTPFGAWRLVWHAMEEEGLGIGACRASRARNWNCI